MCGFAGVVSFSQRCRIEAARAAGLACDLDRDLAHRGPDGSGIYKLGLENGAAGPSPEHPQVLFVHRRLAVIDPRPRSAQPFISADGRLVATYNGEI